MRFNDNQTSCFRAEYNAYPVCNDDILHGDAGKLIGWMKALPGDDWDCCMIFTDPKCEPLRDPDGSLTSGRTHRRSVIEHVQMMDRIRAKYDVSNLP